LRRLGSWLRSGRFGPLSPDTDLQVKDADERKIPPYVVTEISFVCGRKYHSTRNSVKPVTWAMRYFGPLLNRKATLSASPTTAETYHPV